MLRSKYIPKRYNLYVILRQLVQFFRSLFHSEFSSNNIEEVIEKGIKSREYNIEKQTIDPVSNNSQKIKRSRYLRQTYRPTRRRPYYDTYPRNIRRPPYSTYNLRNQFKLNVPMFRSPISKSRSRYYRDSWRHKWPENNLPYAPYSAMDDEEIELEPIDEYDDADTDFKNEETVWYSKKYREGYDDVIPVSSKYSEKRSPLRPYSNFHKVIEYPRNRIRSNYDMYNNFKKDLRAEWQDRNRIMKNYRDDYVNIIIPAEKLKKYAQNYENTFSPNKIENHRFKFAANMNRLKNFDEDEFDFSAKNDLNILRYKNDHSERPRNEEQRNEQEYPDVAKYLVGRNPYSAKVENSQDVVYSSKYRGQNNQEGKDDNEKINEDQLKIDNIHQTQSTTNQIDWKRNQQPIYQEYHLSEVKTNTEVNTARAQLFKNDQSLPSELIAYMSADPAEPVVGKEERYLESRYPFIDKFSDQDILRTAYPGKVSSVIDPNVEITFDERLGDWKY